MPGAARFAHGADEMPWVCCSLPQCINICWAHAFVLACLSSCWLPQPCSSCCQLHLPCLVRSQTGGLGAMKVVKSAAHYTEAARDEITLLSQIAERDPGKRSRTGWVGVGVWLAAKWMGGTACCKAARRHGYLPRFMQGSACVALHPCAVFPVDVRVLDLHPVAPPAAPQTTPTTAAAWWTGLSTRGRTAATCAWSLRCWATTCSRSSGAHWLTGWPTGIAILRSCTYAHLPAD